MSEEVKYVGVVVANTKGGQVALVAKGVDFDKEVCMLVETDTGIKFFPWINVLNASLVKFDSEYTEDDFCADYEEFMV